MSFYAIQSDVGKISLKLTCELPTYGKTVVVEWGSVCDTTQVELLRREGGSKTKILTTTPCGLLSSSFEAASNFVEDYLPGDTLEISEYAADEVPGDGGVAAIKAVYICK